MKAKNRSKSTTPRELSVQTLLKWLSKAPDSRGELEELARAFLSKANLSDKDISLYWQLVFGTVRWLRLLKWHLKKYIKKFSKLPLKVQVILYIGAYQIIFLSKIPYFSAVDESVKLSKKLRVKWAKGLINASLRRLCAGNKKKILKLEDVNELCKEDLINCLSNLTAHPYWMVKRWHKQWGEEMAKKICINNNIQPNLCIRTNSLKITRDELLESLSAQGIKVEKGELAKFSIRVLDFKGNIELLPGFEEGLFQVQDESSQLAVELLCPAPNEKILDVCAGIGGKTTYIAELTKDKAKITATDVSIKRLQKLQENIKRLGLKSITSYHIEQNKKEVLSLAPFDKILIDAPCSGLGVIRRHPDIKWNRIPSMISELSIKQIDLLNYWAPYLKTGGILEYCVCTMEKEETDLIIEKFLDNNKGFILLDIKKIKPHLPEEIVTQGKLRIFPGLEKMDGFFAACLHKRY